jgi:hypothetical protein
MENFDARTKAETAAALSILSDDRKDDHHDNNSGSDVIETRYRAIELLYL